MAFIGVMILTPDTLFMRLSELERWQMVGWRGVLMGITLFIIWLCFMKKNPRNELASLLSIPGILGGMIEAAFISFVILSSIIVLNLFVAILVDVVSERRKRQEEEGR